MISPRSQPGDIENVATPTLAESRASPPSSGTGISIAIPSGWAGFVVPRSGLALKHGIGVVNAPGLIDAAYRGEIKVVLLNTDAHRDYHVQRGERIAQLVVQQVGQVVWQVVEALDGEDRGGGFGHTGRH